jgi:mono/diheme cytochrome c family protein
VRLVLAALTVLVMGAAITGLGMGEAPAERRAAPTAGVVADAKQRIAAGGAATARGRALFEEEGCDRCHSIAAIGAEGKLGPRLDAIDDDADDIAEAIVQPREDIVDGFPEKLMPEDYGDRLSDAQVADLAAFVTAAAGSEGDGGEGDEAEPGGEDAGDDSGQGRGRGRGESSGRGRGGDG